LEIGYRANTSSWFYKLIIDPVLVRTQSNQAIHSLKVFILSHVERTRIVTEITPPEKELSEKLTQPLHGEVVAGYYLSGRNSNRLQAGVPD
jgi:hypothetical protein